MRRALYIASSIAVFLLCVLFVVLYTHDTSGDAKVHSALAKSDSAVGGIAYLVYFTGMQCPHCAITSPVLLKEKVRRYNIMIFEYELHSALDNGLILMSFDKKFNTGLGIPLLIADTTADGIFAGDQAILDSIDGVVGKFAGNKLIVQRGKKTFRELRLKSMMGEPAIWYKDRAVMVSSKAAVKSTTSEMNNKLKEFIIDGTVPLGATHIRNKTVALPGGSITFSSAYKYGGWLLYTDEQNAGR